MADFLRIHPDNPQPRLVEQAAAAFESNAVVVYPTDSGYAIGCSMGNKKSIERVRRFRALDKHHFFTVICSGLSELSSIAKVSTPCFRFLKKHIPGGYTFILPASKKVPKLLVCKRSTVGVRVPKSSVLLAILEQYQLPIVSVSLILPETEESVTDLGEHEKELAHVADCIIDSGYLESSPTTVLDLSHNRLEVIREGSEPVPNFRGYLHD